MPSPSSLLVRLWRRLVPAKPRPVKPERLQPVQPPSPAAARSRRSTIEPLEGRIAPAVLLPGGKELTYTDSNHDKVTIQFSSAIFGAVPSVTDAVLANVFTFSAGAAHTGMTDSTDDVPQNLELIDLTQIPLVKGVNPAAGVSFSIEVTGLPKGHTGIVNVGGIDATDIALGSVTIGGNLGYIDAGDGAHAIGLHSLNVGALGLGAATQAGTTPTYTSTITGQLGALKAGSILGAYVDVVSSSNEFSTTSVVGSIGSINIATSLSASSATNAALMNDGTIQSAGNIGSITIGSGHHGIAAAPGDGLIGGAGDESGAILSGGTLGAVVIKGDIIGGTGSASGAISSVGNFASLTLLGSLEGGAGSGVMGAGDNAGMVESGANLGPVIIGTKTFGGIVGGSADSTGLVSSVGKMGSVKIAGSILGGAGTNSGGVMSEGSLGAVSVSGAVSGGTTAAATLDGFVESEGTLGAVSLGSLVGGAAAQSGYIAAGGAIPSVSVAGQVSGGSGAFSGAIQGYAGIAAVKIGDGLIGGTVDDSGVVFVDGALGTVSISRAHPTMALPGALMGQAGVYSGAVYATGAIGNVTIGGAIMGGAGDHSGSIEGHGAVKSVTAGDVIGGAGIGSGAIVSDDLQDSSHPVAGSLGAISIKSLQGGTGTSAAATGANSGEILSAGNIGSVKISGLFSAGTVTGGGASGAIVAGTGALAPGNIGSVVVGSLGAAAVTSGATTTPAQPGGTIFANGSLKTLSAGQLFQAAVHVGGELGSLSVSGDANGALVTALAVPAAGAKTDLAIGSVTVKGSVTGASFLAGYDANSDPVNGHAQIGAVKVFGDWTASNLIAGVQNSGGTGFGASTDAPIGVTGDLTLVSRIASVVIGGSIEGSSTAGTSYGFEASEIGSFQYGKTKLALNAAAPGQSFVIPVTGASGVTVREVQAPVLVVTSIEGGTGGVDPGQDVILTINYQNQGNQNAQNVTLSATLPVGAQFDAANSAAGWVDSGQADPNGGEIYHLAIGALAVKSGSQPYVGSANFAFTLSSTASAGEETLALKASLSGSYGASQPAAAVSVSEAIPLTAKPVLVVTSVSDGVTSVTTGQNVVFTIDYQNQGNQDAQGVVLSATLPAGAAFDSADSTAGWTDSGTQAADGSEIYHLPVGALAVKNGGGQPVTGTAAFVVNVDSDAPAAVVNVAVTASITAAYNTPADAPAKVSSLAATTPLMASPILQITGLADGVTTVNPGDQVVYTINYTNTGNQDAQQVILSANAPNGTTFNSAGSTAGWVDSTTQAADGSEIYNFPVPTVTGNGAGAGQVMFAVTVNTPATVSSIQETASLTAAYNTGEAPATPPTQTLTNSVS